MFSLIETEPTGPFTRILQTKPFFTSKPNSDVIPPGTINDLYLKSVVNTSVTFSWTAPGNDLDYGVGKGYNVFFNTQHFPLSSLLVSLAVNGYDFKCTLNKNDLLNHFDDITSASDIPHITPNMAKTTQQVTFLGLQDGNTYYCALKAADLINYSPVSNIASYYIAQQEDSGNTEPSQTIGATIMDWIVYVIDFIATSCGMTAFVCCVCRRIRQRRSKRCKEAIKSCKKSTTTNQDTVKIYLTPININRLVVDDPELKENIVSQIINNNDNINNNSDFNGNQSGK